MRRKRVILASLVLMGFASSALVLTSANATPQQASPVRAEKPKKGRVASFNVCNPSRCSSNPANIARKIDRLRPEIIGLQEICVKETKQIARILKRDYGRTYEIQHGSAVLKPSCGTNGGKGAYGNAILSANKIQDGNSHLYRQGGSEERSLAWVKTRIKGKTTFFYTTHLAYKGTESQVRRKQVEKLLDRYALGKDNVIITGDFNATPQASELARMWDDYNDADPKCGNPPRDGCKPTQVGGSNPKKFDYIWLDDDRFKRTGIKRNHYLQDISDHYLVYTDIKRKS